MFPQLLISFFLASSSYADFRVIDPQGDAVYLNGNVTIEDLEPLSIAADELEDLYSDFEFKALTLLYPDSPAAEEPSGTLESEASEIEALESVSTGKEGLQIKVSLGNQTMQVSSGGRELHQFSVSTGSVKRYGRGAATPTGRWQPFIMKKNYYSKAMNAILPWGIKFYQGYLIHASKGAMGTPRSHGCIRLNPADAQKVFQLVQTHGMKNTWITVGA